MVCGVALFLLWSLAAQARDDGRYANAPHKEWYRNQHNAQGQWCCSEADGHPYFGNYTINDDGSVTLDDDRTLPAYMVLKGPNPTGHAVYWYSENEWGRRDYCFSPGTLS